MRTLAAGNRKLLLVLNPQRWPTKLSLQTHPLAPLPSTTVKEAVGGPEHGGGGRTRFRPAWPCFRTCPPSRNWDSGLELPGRRGGTVSVRRSLVGALALAGLLALISALALAGLLLGAGATPRRRRAARRRAKRRLIPTLRCRQHVTMIGATPGNAPRGGDVGSGRDRALRTVLVATCTRRRSGWSLGTGNCSGRAGRLQARDEPARRPDDPARRRRAGRHPPAGRRRLDRSACSCASRAAPSRKLRPCRSKAKRRSPAKNRC